MKTILTIFILACLVLPAAADEVIDSINEGLDAYKAKRFGEASDALQYAVALINEMKGEKIALVFPDAPAGWTKGEVETASLGGGMMGGGNSANCRYTEDGGEGSVEISIMSDSPMISAMSMMLSNPMMIRADGGKLKKFGGNKARLKYDAGERSGEIGSIVMGILVQFEGRNIEQVLLEALAEALDWATLNAIAQE